jgi:hypothetical protein
MKLPAPLLALPFCAAILALCTPAQGQTVRGSIGGEMRIYPDAPLFPDQDPDDVQASATATLNASADVGEARFDVELFGRFAPDAARELSGDVRQAFVRLQRDKAEWKLGVLSETWGVLEAWNPVDIINQRDLVEDFQGDVKLGQPGMLMTYQLEGATLSFFGTAVARERRFARREDRFRVLPASIVDEDLEDGRWAPTGAIRAEVPVNALNLGLSQFLGTAREPILSPIVGAGGLEGFRAFYGRISQTSIDAEYVVGDSVLKAELIHQRGDARPFWGGGIGIETSFSKFGGGLGDLTLYAEAYADSRDDDAPLTPFQRDVFVGARYSFNDTGDTLLELRHTYDLEWRSSLLELRANRRLFSDFVLSFAFLTTLNQSRDPALSALGRDTQFKLRLARYF